MVNVLGEEIFVFNVTEELIVWLALICGFALILVVAGFFADLWEKHDGKKVSDARSGQGQTGSTTFERTVRDPFV
jgi:hypothetical protein